MKRLKLFLLCSILFKILTSARSDDIKEKCELYLPIIRTSFRIVIPDFNAKNLEVVFKTGRGISIPPTNPIFAPFLHHYYVSGINLIKKSPTDDRTLRSALLLYFNIQYTKFLKRYGIPLSCISFYTGNADEKSVNQLQQLYSKLNLRFGSSLNSDGVPEKNSYLGSLTGKDISSKLRMTSPPFHETVKDTTQDSKICEQLFIELKDGSMQAKMPVLSSGDEKIGIPGTAGFISASQVNITHQLSRYFSTAIRCLQTQDEKISFSSVVYNWLSQQLIPGLVQKSTCVRGFPRIIELMNSIDSFVSELGNNGPRSSTTMISAPKQRRKRSLKRDTNVEHESHHDWNNMEDQHDIHDTLRAEDTLMKKVLYDAELKSLYDRLNGHFLRNNLQISRLDIIELPHHDKRRKRTTKKPTTTSTSTTTTTPPPTTTEEMEEDEEEEETVTEHIVIKYPTKKIKTGHRVKVVGEFEVNEDNLQQPLSVSVEGKKLRAQLDVSPLNKGEGNLIVGHPVFKRGHGLYHSWHFGVHNHTEDDDEERKPVHAIHYLLKKKYGPDPSHKDFVQQIADTLGGYFWTKEKKEQKTSHSHSHKKRKKVEESSKTKDMGLKELRDVEKEIPPV